MRAYCHENWKPFDVYWNAVAISFDNVKISEKNFEFAMPVKFYPYINYVPSLMVYTKGGPDVVCVNNMDKTG